MRIAQESILLTLSCIFLESAGARNRRYETHEIEKDKNNYARIPVGQGYYIRSDVSEGVENRKKVERKCKGKYSSNEMNDEDEKFYDRNEENDWKFIRSHETRYEKFKDDDTKNKKPLKLKEDRARRTNIKNMSKRDLTERDEDEIKTSSKKRIIENVIVVKDKLGHLKEKIDNIKKAGIESGEKRKYNEKTKIMHKNEKSDERDKKTYKTKENENKYEESGSSEEQKPYIKVKHKLRSLSLKSEEDTEGKEQKFETVPHETPKNQKKPKNVKHLGEYRSEEYRSVVRKTESNGDIGKKVEIDINSSRDHESACDKSEEMERKDNNCSNEEDGMAESNFHTNKFKFSIKYAHEKKKGFPNRDHHFIKKIHGVEKKKHRFGDEDDEDFDEQDDLPKRPYHVMDDED